MRGEPKSWQLNCKHDAITTTFEKTISDDLGLAGSCRADLRPSGRCRVFATEIYGRETERLSVGRYLQRVGADRWRHDAVDRLGGGWVFEHVILQPAVLDCGESRGVEYTKTREHLSKVFADARPNALRPRSGPSHRRRGNNIFSTLALAVRFKMAGSN